MLELIAVCLACVFQGIFPACIIHLQPCTVQNEG